MVVNVLCLISRIMFPFFLSLLACHRKRGKKGRNTRGQPLSDGEHKALSGWGTHEDRALRDMSFSAGEMVKRARGNPRPIFQELTLLWRCGGEKGYPRPKSFWEVSLSVDIFAKNLSAIAWSHAIFGAIFGKMGGCFRLNGCMQLEACP